MGLASGSNRLELTLLEELASGTFARVYLAEAKGAEGVDRLVAVKVLREKWADSEEVLARTRDEARLLARLRHKHIVRVEELSAFDDQPAIIMEYVEGLNLQQLLDSLKARGRGFPHRAALMVGMATASALDAAYRRVPYGLEEPLQVVHRDVKPSNVMISIDGEVKVLDFGTARATSPLRSAKTGMVRFGSWKYMSPERKEGDRGDHASDTYSLGLLLIELLGSEWIKGLPVSPHEHDTALCAVLDGIRDLGMPNDAWNQALRDLLMQMSAFSTDVRPSSQQLVDVLRQYSEQARGQNIDALAADVIQSELRGQREQLPEGVLTGTRLFVSLDGSTPPRARRPDGELPTLPDVDGDPDEPRTDPFGGAGSGSPSPAIDDEDDFDEPAAIVEPFPSVGRYAMGSTGAAQVRFNPEAEPAPSPDDTWGRPANEQPAPQPSEQAGFGAAPAPQPAWPPPNSGQQAPVPAEPAPAAPAPAWSPPRAQPAQVNMAYSHEFQPVSTAPVETEHLPPPDAAQYGSPAPSGPPVADPYVATPMTAPPVATAPIAAGPVAAGPTAPAPAPAKKKKKKSKLPLILGVLVVLFVLCTGVPTVGWVAYSLYLSGNPDIQLPSVPGLDTSQIGTSPDPSEGEQTPPAQTDPVQQDPTEDGDPGTPATPTASADAGAGTDSDAGAPVNIRAADRTIRRIELTAVEGDLQQDSKGSLEGNFPPGRYTLSIKIAGRDPFTKELDLHEAGLHLLCAPDEKMAKVLCKNADGDITLALSAD